MIHTYDNAGRIVTQAAINKGQSRATLELETAGAFVLEVTDERGRVFVNRIANW